MLESYLTPLLTSYLNKYIKNLKPSDLQLSFWGGDAILRNLELRLDAIEELLSSMAPFEMKSGNVKQLTVHIPWTSIGSEPIEITFESVECTIKLKDLSLSSKNKPTETRQPAKETQPSIDQPQAPGYLQGLISRISNNVILHVNNLLVKVIEEQCDLLMSVSVKQLNCCTANDNWEKAFVFTDSLRGDYHLHNLCFISDMTVCLDVVGSSGQVEVFESPFVPKCSLVCRLARYFKGGTFVETKLDVLCEGELHFSVSEQQFSLFLHLLDWLLAMYYSFKKLKGRDDNDSSEEELTTEQTKHSPSRSPKSEVSGATKGSVDLEAQQNNWGSWMMSFITGEDEDETIEGNTVASPPPTLSLSVHAPSISVALCATGCRQQPIFPSSFNKHKHTSQVVLARFTGCMARVVRAPSNAFLACSVGIMSVGAWVCGSCPCDEQTTPDRRRGLSPVDRMEQVYVYTLGTVLDEAQTKMHLLAGSLFANVSEDPEYTEYLRQREAYNAVWFSYHDLDVMEGREVEECNEKLVIGKALLFLSLDVIHRCIHFIQSFLDTLEAHPLLSNGITVIGDPRSKTELQFQVLPISVLLTTRVHFISHKKQQLMSPVSSSPTSTPALLGCCDGIQGKLIMPTYSGNAVAEFSQCRLLEISLTGLSFSTVTLLSSGLDMFQSLVPGSSAFSLPLLSFSFYQQMFVEKSADNSYWQINSPASTIHASSRQLEPLLQVVQSWRSKLYPSSQPTEDDSTLVLNLSNLSGEWSQNEADTSYSASLGRVSISLVTTNRPVSILHSPSNTQSWSTIEAWSTNLLSSPFSANKAAELYVCVPTKSRKGDGLPQFKLTVAGVSIHISSAVLRYMETVHFLSVLKESSADEADKVDYETLETHSDEDGNKFDLLLWLKSCNMEVNISPMVVAVSIDAPDFNVEGNSKPLDSVDDVFYDLFSSSSIDVAVFTIPSMVVSSTNTGFHPALTPLGAPSNPQSWHCLLAGGTAFTRLSGTAKHLLHPVSFEVSVATVKPATPTQAHGLGVHVDINDVHVSLSVAQVVLLSRIFFTVKSTIATATHSSSSPSLTATTPIALLKESSSGYAPSLTPSPLLSHLSLSLPLPPSESSISTHSSFAIHHSLWMQVTLSRLTVELNSNKTTINGYVLEAEDTSVSVDIQDKSSSYHFKLFSLEVTSGQVSTGVQAPFTKLFSSSSSVFRESASEVMEDISPLSSTISPHTPPLSNFFTVDVVTHQSAHKSTQVCVRVQSFEAVLWLDFMKCLLEIFSAFEERVSGSTLEEKNDSSSEDTKRQHTVEFWPHADVYFKCFHLLVPTSSLSSTLIVDCGEVAITSDLSFPVSRLTLDASSLRNLELLSSERRQPPLPGYQLSARSVSAKIISSVIKTDHRFQVAILSSPTDIRAVYSPPLSCPPSLPHPLGRQTKSTVGSGLAAGTLIELHIDSDLTINITPEEVKVFLELIDDIRKAATSFTNDDHTNVPYTTDTIPVQLLATGRVVQVVLPSGEKLCDGSGERSLFETSFFNPVFMVNVGDGVSVEFSLFNTSVATTSDCSDKNDPVADCMSDASYTSVVETRPGTSDSISNNSSLPPNLLIVRVEIKDNSSAVSIQVGRPVKISLSPSIVQQLLGMSMNFLQLLKPVEVSSNENHSSDDPFSVFQLISKISTSQVVVEVLGQQENEGVGKFVLSWEELSTLPSVESQRIREEVSTSIALTGVHLVCVPGGVIGEGDPVFMVAPTDVECSISCHSPQSIYDSPHTEVLLSCDLLHGEFNRLVLFQANCIVQEYFSAVFKNDMKKDPPAMRAERPPCSDKKSVHFEDDLKRGEFKFITENKEGWVTPCPAEVIIMEEKKDKPAAIVWQYREPRIVSSVKSSPVPLVLPDSQRGNLKVICTLCQWADGKPELITTATFTISESIPSTAQVKHHSPARIWGIMVTALEWVEGDRIVNRVELPSADYPISSIFPPVGLVACTRVDSSTVPASIPTLTVSASIKEASLLLTHLPSNTAQKENDYLAFQGFKVCDDVSLHKLELAKLVLTNLSSKFALQAGEETTAEVGCLATVQYTDLQDLTWVTVSSPTELAVCYQEKIKEESRMDLRETVINLDVGSLGVRLSPSLVHSATVMSYLCRYDETDRQTIVCSRYIICNNTVEDLQLRQASTYECIALPRKCCIGYVWMNHRTVTKLLQVRLEAHQCSKWSKPFSINCENGQQLISFDNELLSLYVVIKSSGGFHKMVTFVGGLKFSSLLPFPLSLRLMSQPAVLDSDPQQSQQYFEYNLPAYGDGELPSLTIPEATGVQARQAGQTRWSLVLPIGSHRKGWSRPQLLTEVPSQDGMCQCWVKSVSSETVGENLSVEVTFAPLLTVTNMLPFDIQLTITPASGDSGGLEGGALLWCTIPGQGLTTAASCGLRCDQSNYIYLKHGDSHEVSPPLSFSLADTSQLSVTAEDCTCDWPYNDCTHHWPDGHKPKCTEFFLSCAGRKFYLVASFLSSGAVNLLLAPQCLIVNKLELPIFLKQTNEKEECLSVEKSSVVPFTLGEVQVGIRAAETNLWSAPLMLTDTVGCTKLTLAGSPEHKVTCSLMMRQSTRYGCVVFTVMPTHLLVNQTGMMLKTNCLLSRNCQSANRICITDISPNEHAALLFWQTSEQAAYTLILTADASLSSVSIPLPLNFVRRSFSLPCSTKDGATAIPCLLSTHDQDNTTYVVVSKDPFPRLLISNLSSKSLEVTEAKTTDLYCHPQYLGVGEIVAYEPPSLAKQYPLINSKENEENEQGNSVFKTVDQVLLKLRISGTEIEEEKEWSKPFHLLLDSEQVVRVPNYESLFVTVSSKEATVLVSLLTMTGDHCADNVSHEPAIVKPLKFTCHIKELVVCLDREEVTSSADQAVARIITESIDLFFSKNSEESTGRIAMSSIQIDNMTGDSTEYKVVFTPRREHIPSHHLVKTDMPPFLLITFLKATSPSSVFHEIHISVQPATIQLDSSFLQSMKDVFATFKPPEILKSKVNSGDEIPATILVEASQDEMPLVITSLIVEQLSVYVSARVTMKMALSCDDTLLQFARYELTNVYSNQMELSNCIAAHYTTQLIWQIWWSLGSLDLIGSPTVLFHSIRSGVSDFFSLPYEGLTMGPGFFIVGLGQGVASLVGSLSGGMLRSLTNFSSGVAHNMEKLSLDPEHASYQEEYRRKGEVPARLSSGLASGASSFGLSVVSALAGVVDQPMRSVQAAGEAEMGLGGYASSVIKGFGKGLLGVVTKPVGGAFQLVSQTSQGLMNSVGLLHIPQHKITSCDEFCALMKRTRLHPTNTKYLRLLFMDGHIIFCTCGTLYTGFKSTSSPCYILLTTCYLLIVPTDKDQLLHRFSVHKHTITVSPSCIPGEASLTISQIQVQQNPSPCHSTKFHTPEQEDDDLYKAKTTNKENSPVISLLPHRARTLCHFFKTTLRQESDTYFCSF